MYCLSHEVSLIIKGYFKEVDGINKLLELDALITDAQHWFSSHACVRFLRQQTRPGENTAFV